MAEPKEDCAEHLALKQGLYAACHRLPQGCAFTPTHPWHSAPAVLQGEDDVHAEQGRERSEPRLAVHGAWGLARRTSCVPFYE